MLPKLAKVLGARVEQILEGELPETRRAGPVGKVQKLFEEVSTLPRKQQDRIAETVSALVAQYKRGAYLVETKGRSRRRPMSQPKRRSDEQELLKKIRTLPPERVAEVEDFVDFLRQRDEEQQLTQAASRLSEAAFARIWESPDDADYDRL